VKPLTPLQRLRRLLGYGVAAVLVLAALMLTGVRLVLPHASGYRAQVEAWVGGYLGHPVRIEGLDARLLVLSPTLILDGVALVEPGGSRELARFASIHVGIDPIASLRGAQLVMSELTVVGARLAVERRSNGELVVEGLSLPRNGRQSDEDPFAVTRWLLAQQHLTLRESSLLLRDQVTGREHAFEKVTLELRNDGHRHRLNAALHLPDDLGSTLHVSADLHGDLLHLPEVTGEVYAAVERARPAGVHELLPITGLPDAAGEVTAQAWGRWEGRLQSLEGEFAVEHLAIDGPEGPFRLDALGARFSWHHADDGNVFELADLTVTRAGRRWAPTRAQVRYVAQPGPGLGPLQLQASFLRLEDVSAAAALFPFDTVQRQTLQELGAVGDLRNVHIAWDGARWRAGAEFKDLVLAPHASRPGVRGLDGYAWYAHGEAGLRLATREAVLLMPKLFRDPLSLRHLHGELRLHRDGPAWRLTSRELVASNDDISLRAAVTVTVPDSGSPHLDLVGDFRDGRATAVYRYLPVHIMPDATVRWLDRAFKAGRVREGSVVFHGRLHDFPFERAPGRFLVRFHAEDVQLDYMPHWPQLEQIDGEVVFDGGGMRIEARAARLMGSAVQRAVVTIPELRRARLLVDGQVQGPLSNIFDYLRISGLAGEFAGPLAGFTAGGQSALALRFELPLSVGGAPPQVGGAVRFLDSRLRVAEGVEFTDIYGTLDFAGRVFKASGIAARLFGEPVTVGVLPRGPGTEVLFAGTVLGAGLAKHFPSPVSQRLHGRASWNGRLIIGDADGESRLRIQSPLEGMGVDLPAPFRKPADERQDLEVTTYFTGPRAHQTDVTLRGRASAVWERDADGALARAALHFGADTPPSLPEPAALRITGQLDGLEPAAWTALLPQGPALRASAPRRPPLPVVVALEKLDVRLPAGAAAGTEAAPSDELLPPLKVQVEHFSLDGRPLGRLAFETVPGPGQMVLRDLSLRGQLLEISGSGHWRRGLAARTQVELVVHSPNLGSLAQGLGLASTIRKGRMDAELKISWPGAPQAYAMARTNGNVHVKIIDGVLEEVEPGAGRLLGLLSLEALPRRLTLDFRDIFEKGIRFRVMEGTFRIEDGNAYTSDLHVNTLPAGVFISGRTGLANRDYDHTITVVPEVAGSLPVAGGIALGPQVGAVLLLFQSIFKKQIDQAAKFHYTVTGPWEKPVVKRLENL
jgi:uncharacterized protein (TIGR02099 family)